MKEKRSLLGIEHLPTEDIVSILRLAKRFQKSRPRRILKDKRIALLFYEASTRTRVSFEFAAKMLGARTTLISATASRCASAALSLMMISMRRWSNATSPDISWPT